MRWIENWLNGRTQSVVISSAESSWSLSQNPNTMVDGASCKANPSFPEEKPLQSKNQEKGSGKKPKMAFPFPLRKAGHQWQWREALRNLSVPNYFLWQRVEGTACRVDISSEGKHGHPAASLQPSASHAGRVPTIIFKIFQFK